MSFVRLPILFRFSQTVLGKSPARILPVCASNVPSTNLGLPIRHMASKGKHRSKCANEVDRPRVLLDDEQMERVLHYEQLQEAVVEVIEQLKNDLINKYNLRVVPRQVESLSVLLDGQKVTFADIATIGQKRDHLLVVNLSATPNAVKSALNAIHQSGLAVNVQQEGNVLYLALASHTTTEHREALAKSVKQAGQKTKDKLKDRNFSKRFYKVKQADSKRMGIDLMHQVADNLDYYLKLKCAEVQQIVDKKVHSIANK